MYELIQTAKYIWEATILLSLILVILLSNTSAEYWSSNIGTNSTSWSIYRQSENASFNLSSSVEGKISQIEYNGRILKPYHSYYAEVIANDVRLRERTSALEGSYKSEDLIMVQANCKDKININVFKPIGTEVFTISYHERWPVLLTASRTLKYLGLQINDRDFEGNNQDFVGSNLLYNHELSKERKIVMWLKRMNATVQTTNDAILTANLKPTKYLGYLTQTHTTGIADFSYRLSGLRYDPKKGDYPALSEGEERYYGTYNLLRKIEMRSLCENYSATEGWLPCCYSGWFDMALPNQRGYSANTVFNCSC